MHKIRRWVTAFALGVLGAATVLPSALADGAAPAGAQSAPSDWAAVVTGLDSAAWLQMAGPGGAPSYVWTSYGGVMLPGSTPAVVGDGSTPVLLAVGTDHHLYLATRPDNWMPLGGYCLYSPTGAMVAPNTLAAACIGGDGRVWAQYIDTGTAPFTPWGYFLPVGPAGAPAAGAGPAVISGRYWEFVTSDHQVYYYDLAHKPLAPWTLQPGDYCVGHIAASAYVGFGCHGLDGQLWLFPPPEPAGGQLIGGPGIAGNASGVALFAEGTDHRAYMQVLGTNNWFGIGGWIIGDGINAAALG